MPRLVFFEGYEDLRGTFDQIAEIYSLSGVSEKFNITRRSFPTQEALEDVVKGMGIKPGQWQDVSYELLREFGFNTNGLA
jgi:hypothetical protein